MTGGEGWSTQMLTCKSNAAGVETLKEKKKTKKKNIKGLKKNKHLSHCVVLQAPSADGSHRAGERDLPPAEREEDRGGRGDYQYVWRAGAGAASAQDGPHHRPGEHLQHQTEG